MSVDIQRLRELLAAVPCAEVWTAGCNSHCIETSQRAPNGDIYGRSLFEPDERDDHSLAEAQLAVAAVNALPALLAIAEAAGRIVEEGCCTCPRAGTMTCLVCKEILQLELLFDAARKERT